MRGDAARCTTRAAESRLDADGEVVVWDHERAIVTVELLSCQLYVPPTPGRDRLEMRALGTNHRLVGTEP
jgi:hypothetical protein